MTKQDAGPNVPEKHRRNDRVGDWLPGDHRAHKEWLNNTIDHVDSHPKDLHPVLKEFKGMIENNSRVYLLMTSMFSEIPQKKVYKHDPTGLKQIRDYEHMLQLLNHFLTTAPHWTDKANHVHMVGLPINAVFDWPMGTASGYALFLDPEVNAMLKKVLNAWGEYLMSIDSAKQVIHDKQGGWLGKTSKPDLEQVANKAAGTSHTFEDAFVCDPSQPHHGYKSWDDFFTRLFREGIRPVASPKDDSVIANACESKPFQVKHDVKLRDQFWIKGQPYSPWDMLGQDERATQFAGGTVYQAFLSALSYHRWHSPVSGKIVKAFVKDGTYYSEPLFETLGDPENAEKGTATINEAGETISQGYISSMATRGIVFIEADNKDIGLMAFIGVGMSEVSTCDITVKEGQKVKKGDELGMFHFGGSSHCLMFRKGVDVQGFPQPGREENVPVRSELARVHSRT